MNRLLLSVTLAVITGQVISICNGFIHSSSIIRRDPTRIQSSSLFDRTSTTTTSSALFSNSAEEIVSAVTDTQIERGMETFPIERYFNVTINLPPYYTKGEVFESEPFTIQYNDEVLKFKILCYPKGGGHNRSKRSPIELASIPKNEAGNVQVYLQYLPDKNNKYADINFAIRLIGQQASGPKFDLEWAAGMRFVELQNSSLRLGRANDFGSSLMQAELLPNFLGETKRQLKCQVRMKVQHVGSLENVDSSYDESLSLVEKLNPRDIRIMKGNNTEKSKHSELVRTGRIIVPVLKSLKERPRMFEVGAYPGVEYRIMRIFDGETGDEIFESKPGAEYEIRPIYPLVQQLERQWPVRVKSDELSLVFTTTMYNFVSAAGSLFTAIGGLTAAFIVSLAISLYFIPSKSMDPTLQKGDVLLVEKVSQRLTGGAFARPGDVVLFNVPEKLQEVVLASGGKRIDDRDLFVKRVVGVSGDHIKVEKSGKVEINGRPTSGNRQMCDEEPLKLIEKYIDPTEYDIPENEIFVMGDCSDVSVDSRVWGTLKRNDIVGHPLMRIWPSNRLGEIPSLPVN